MRNSSGHSVGRGDASDQDGSRRQITPRIASLLPSATEICFALGLGSQVVGVSHECDHPAEARGLPILTRSTIDSRASSRDIDLQVKEQLSQGLSLYQVQEALLAQLEPSLVVTQDTCDLCAVSFSTVQASVARLLGPEARVVSLSPVGVDDVLGDMVRVAEAAGVRERGEALHRELSSRFEELRQRTRRLNKPKVLMLEWLDPPMAAGHWTPQLIRWAGGEPVLCHHREPTRSTTWEALAAAEVDHIFVAPCGFAIERASQDWVKALREHPELQQMPAVRRGKVSVFDGNAYFNRPGPRLVESAWWLAKALHPDAMTDLADDPAVLRSGHQIADALLRS